MLNISESISFQDVLLIPKHTSYAGPIATSVSINRGEIEYSFTQPIVPSNSFLITDVKMAVSLISKNCLALFHNGTEYYRLSHSETALKYNLIKSLKEIKDICINFIGKTDYFKYLGFTVGVTDSDYDVVQELYNHGVRIFCIQNVIGDSDAVLAMIEFVRKLDSQNLILSGNVVTGKAAKTHWLSGSDIVIVGNSGKDNVRENTGCGVPQLTALIDCAAEKSRGQYLLSNGGINNSGDLVKALCFADFVMSQRMFESSFEAPVSNSNVGLEILLNRLLKDILMGCRMQNVLSIKDLQEDISMVRLTSSGIMESRLT